jgi:hypothetical protein
VEQSENEGFFEKTRIALKGCEQGKRRELSEADGPNVAQVQCCLERLIPLDEHVWGLLFMASMNCVLFYLPSGLDFNPRRAGAIIRRCLPIVALISLTLLTWMYGVAQWHWDLQGTFGLGIDPISNDLGLMITLAPVLICAVLLFCLLAYFLMAGYIPHHRYQLWSGCTLKPYVSIAHVTGGDFRPPRAASCRVLSCSFSRAAV